MNEEDKFLPTAKAFTRQQKVVEPRTRFHLIGEDKEAQLPLECSFASDLFHIDQHEYVFCSGLTI